ncbi:hypothetical protein MPTK1_7g13060 [Marchantia polymorpha subsp. ruderalis]|uniref:Uncharacterized protein n=2 Tax=Marchantia polymorpha TaxID=3197 RepID=A0AAF6BZ16_MARPO|nr:hypothetical protein MARPO_0003s0314 [Marchantia polymorpha]BBN17250.1 hypothetical protein Mp_7g13060 [Marchantia polymorpha subsp. ruderalis]|eukprot:PTQ49485.1 hypothetical protein MARPO_0003s0314 [Marchantia polymorpha]
MCPALRGFRNVCDWRSSPKMFFGGVASHQNIRSLIFKRRGLKLKSFVSIIRAAATSNSSTKVNISKLESEGGEKKKSGFLTSVGFKNCMHLLDTDVSLLCSLHSKTLMT